MNHTPELPAFIITKVRIGNFENVLKWLSIRPEPLFAKTTY